MSQRLSLNPRGLSDHFGDVILGLRSCISRGSGQARQLSLNDRTS